MAPLDGRHVDRYLRHLRLEREPPGLGALGRITAAHAARVPFENVSKLFRWKRMGLDELPDAETHLAGMERWHLGGTCYAIAWHLHGLLLALGYEVRLCGADMQEPDSHLVLLVRVSGRDVLVDAGYAAPFLEPLPLDGADPIEVRNGRDRYLLSPRDEAGRSRVDLVRGGARVHGYVVNPAARRIEEFREVVSRSFSREAIFMNTLILTRFLPGRSVAIHGPTVVRTDGDRVETAPLRDGAAVIEEVQRSFGIPTPITAAALEGMSAIADPWRTSPGACENRGTSPNEPRSRSSR